LAATVMFAWTPKPSRCAWHGPREVTHGHRVRDRSGARGRRRAAERDPSLDRRTADAGQGGRLLGERVDVARVIDVEAAADKEPLDAAIDAGEQPCDFLVAQRLGGVERERAVGSLDEYAVQDEGMEVDVQLKAAPEALDHCAGSAPPIGH